MGNLGTPEIILIFLVILIFFGGKKIPEIARGLGKGIREFRRAKEGLDEELEKDEKEKKAGEKESDKTGANADEKTSEKTADKAPPGTKNG